MDIDTINPYTYIPEATSITFQELSLLIMKIPNNSFRIQLNQNPNNICNKNSDSIYRRIL